MGLSAVFDCGISLSYSLTIFVWLFILSLIQSWHIGRYECRQENHSENVGVKQHVSCCLMGFIPSGKSLEVHRTVICNDQVFCQIHFLIFRG